MTTSPVLDFSALDLARMLVGVLSAAGGVGSVFGADKER